MKGRYVMKWELERAIFSRWNILLIFFILGIMFINAYNGGWNTALHVMNAVDIVNQEDKIYFAKYYGNTYRVWSDSYYMLQALTPILLGVPYILSYINEKNNRFRNFMIIREGRKKYLFNKLLSITLSGAIILGFSEFLFYFITYFLTSPSTNFEYVDGLIKYKNALFMSKPVFYFAVILLLHIIYYFSFGIFAVGITSVLKRKSAIIIMPFLLVAILDLVLPVVLQPNVIMQPNKSSHFSLVNFLILDLVYVIVGVICYTLNEKRIRRQGV